MNESDHQKGLKRDFPRPDYRVNDVKIFNLTLRVVDADIIRHMKETNLPVRRGI